MCLFMISSQSPSLVEKVLALHMRMYLLLSPVKIIWYPPFFQDDTLSSKSDIKATPGYSLLFY